MGQRTARIFGIASTCFAGLGALIALGTPEKACPSNYVQFFPLKIIAIVVSVVIAGLGITTVLVARREGPHRIAAALAISFTLVALMATAATVVLAHSGFDSCWTF